MLRLRIVAKINQGSSLIGFKVYNINTKKFEYYNTESNKNRYFRDFKELAFLVSKHLINLKIHTIQGTYHYSILGNYSQNICTFQIKNNELFYEKGIRYTIIEMSADERYFKELNAETEELEWITVSEVQNRIVRSYKKGENRYSNIRLGYRSNMQELQVKDKKRFILES